MDIHPRQHQDTYKWGVHISFGGQIVERLDVELVVGLIGECPESCPDVLGQRFVAGGELRHPIIHLELAPPTHRVSKSSQTRT